MLPLSFGKYSKLVDDPTLSLSHLSSDLEANLPISSLFILFVIIGGNYMSELFPCRLQGFLGKNMLAKHALGFFTLLLFVELTNATGDEDGVDWKTTFTRSLLLYVWFVLTTTMEPSVFFFLLVLLAFLYALRIYIYKRSTKANPVDIKMVAKLRKLETALYYSCIGVTMFGVIAYYGRKKNELGKDFNIAKFFIGKIDCKGSRPDKGAWNSFLMAFRKN